MKLVWGRLQIGLGLARNATVGQAPRPARVPPDPLSSRRPIVSGTQQTQAQGIGRWRSPHLFTLPLLALSLCAAQGLQFTVTDARGKETTAITIEAAQADENGWAPIHIAKVKEKSKAEPVIVWPFDGLVKTPDGSEPISAIVIQKGDERALMTKSIVAAIATPIVLGLETLPDTATKLGLPSDALNKAFADLLNATDAYQKGVGLLYAGKTTEAAEQLATALRERQRRLTRVPSDIYPAALLSGQAFLRARKFDEAAVAFLAAQKLRPSSELAARLRDEALIKAGKADAVGR